MIDKESSAKGGRAVTPAKLAALAAARAKRKTATTPIAPPPGWPSWEALRVNTKDYCGRELGRIAALSRYIGAGTSSVRRWLRGQKIPRQSTVDKIGQWRRVKDAGL